MEKLLISFLSCNFNRNFFTLNCWNFYKYVINLFISNSINFQLMSMDTIKYNHFLHEQTVITFDNFIDMTNDFIFLTERLRLKTDGTFQYRTFLPLYHNYTKPWLQHTNEVAIETSLAHMRAHAYAQHESDKSRVKHVRAWSPRKGCLHTDNWRIRYEIIVKIGNRI